MAPTARSVHLLDQCRSGQQSVAVDLVLLTLRERVRYGTLKRCFLQSRYPVSAEFWRYWRPPRNANKCHSCCVWNRVLSEESASEWMATS